MTLNNKYYYYYYNLLTRRIWFCIFSSPLVGKSEYWVGLKVDERKLWTDTTAVDDYSKKYGRLLTKTDKCVYLKWDSGFVVRAGPCTDEKMYVCQRTKGKVLYSLLLLINVSYVVFLRNKT